MSYVVLRDGSVFSKITVTETMAKLEQFRSEVPYHFQSLIEHCKHHPNDPPLYKAYPLSSSDSFPDSLQRYGLVNRVVDRKVSLTVRTILLNSIDEGGGGFPPPLRNPVVRVTHQPKEERGFNDASARCCLLIAIFSGIFLLAAGAEAYYKRAFR